MKIERTPSADRLTISAVVAAMYAAATIMLSPFSLGVMQIRLSEALISICAFEPAAVAGIGVGCFIANILGPNGITDAIIGSIASIIGAFFVYKLREKPAIAFLPNIIINGVLIGAELVYFYSVDINPMLCMLWVAAGEAVACYGGGLPLMMVLKKRGGIKIK